MVRRSSRCWAGLYWLISQYGEWIAAAHTGKDNLQSAEYFHYTFGQRAFLPAAELARCHP